MPLGRNIDSLLAAVTGAAIILLFCGHGGIGISPDSVVYISTANNMLTNGSVADFTNNPTVDFPFFYPFFLGCISWVTRLKPLLFGHVLNAVLFGLVIYLSGYIMDRFMSIGKWCKWALLSCLVFSPCLLEVYAMLWSETLFILLLLLFMVLIHGYLKSHSRKLLVAIAAVASIAAVTRYAGIVIIGTGGLLLLLDMNQSKSRKTVDLIIYSIISPLLLVINLARNHAVTDTLTGNREPSVTTLGKNLHDTGTVFHEWLPFLNGQSAGTKWTAIAIIVFLLCLCLVHFLRTRSLSNFESIAASFSLCYILFMVVMATFSRFEGLNSRFFSPVFIPLLLIAGNRLYLFSKRARAFRYPWIAVVFCAAIFVAFQYKQLAADYETWDGVKDAGIPGYTEDSWKQMEIVQFLQQQKLSFKRDHTIYSNSNDALYFMTGRTGHLLPHKDLAAEVRAFMEERDCYVIIFNDGENTDLVNTGFIVSHKKMKLLHQFEDGAIYVTEK